MTRMARVSSSYRLPESSSSRAMIGHSRPIRNTSLLSIDAAAIRASPPPKSTLRRGSGSNPVAVRRYSMNTELPISRNRPQSQFWWQCGPKAGSCATSGKR